MKFSPVKIKDFILDHLYIGACYFCFRPKVIYRDPDMKKHPVKGIYICNHSHLPDGILLRAVFRKCRLYSLIADHWLENRFLKTCMFYDFCIPVNRENPDTGWIRECRRVLKEGGSVNIFPEGTVSKCYETMEFKPGFLVLAAMTGAPIIPVATNTEYHYVFGRRTRILVGEPIFFDRSKFSLKEEEQQKLAEEFRSIIVGMKEELSRR